MSSEIEPVESGWGTSEGWITAVVATLGAIGPLLAQIYPNELPEWARVASILCGSLVSIITVVFYQKTRTERKNVGDTVRIAAKAGINFPVEGIVGMEDDDDTGSEDLDGEDGE